jgi:hypothetical protein
LTGVDEENILITIYIKTTIQEIRLNVSPNRRLPILFEGKPISALLSRQTSVYLITYDYMFVIFLIITSISAPILVLLSPRTWRRG